ncbi:MAG: CPBP family intramembrane metalloprotease [Oscillospiraceae bacterium]|nr:CPBP family intramembrane metalloprotease [Oscillospiraceae bacterium]
MKNTPLKYRLNVIGGGLIIFICIRTYVPMIAQSIGLRDNFNTWLAVYMITLAAACILPIAFIEKMCDFHPVLFEKKRLEPVHGAMILEGMLIFILLAIVNSLVLGALGKVGISFPPQSLEKVDSRFTLLLYFIFSAVIPAIFEELFIRGIVLNLLLPNGRRFAILASAVLFTVMHTQVQSFIPVFGAGVVLACIYMYTGNIFVSMALHFVNNAYSFIMMYMQQSVNGISAMGFYAFVMAVLIVGGGSSRVYLNRNNINIFDCLKKEGKNAAISRFFGCPVMVLGLLCCGMAIGAQLYADLIM